MPDTASPSRPAAAAPRAVAPRPAERTPALELRGLSKRRPAFRLGPVDLRLEPGSVAALVGANGAGKSTLLGLIAGVLHADAGTVRAFGHPVRAGDALGPALAYAPDPHPWFERWSAARNLAALAAVAPRWSDADAAAAAERLALDLARPVRTLSKGNRVKLGLVAALAQRPQLLLLDEPTAGLDPITAAAFDKLIRDLQQALGLTVFLVTHDLDTLHAVCDRIAVIGEKRVLAVGTIAELRRHDHPWIQEYFGGPRGRAAAAGH